MSARCTNGLEMNQKCSGISWHQLIVRQLPLSTGFGDSMTIRLRVDHSRAKTIGCNRSKRIVESLNVN